MATTRYDLAVLNTQKTALLNKIATIDTLIASINTAFNTMEGKCDGTLKSDISKWMKDDSILTQLNRIKAYWTNTVNDNMTKIVAAYTAADTAVNGEFPR